MTNFIEICDDSLNHAAQFHCFEKHKAVKIHLKCFKCCQQRHSTNIDSGNI